VQVAAKSGAFFDRYEVVGFIQKGGVGGVYHVVHTELGSPHAMKILHGNACLAMQHALEREGRIQANLNHRNIVRVTDLFRWYGGVPVIVMDLVDGPSMGEALDDGPFGFDEAVWIFKELLRGVQHIHSREVIHRDLKTDNILLARENWRRVPKIIDFGFATHHEDPPNLKLLTDSYAIIGTPEYMAPEQISKPSAVDHRADLYSLGCILYEMLTAKLPFDGDSPREILGEVMSGEYISVRELRPETPEVLCQTVDRLLQWKPLDRFGDCLEVLRALD
jgi:serine/threonine protein kinase